MKPQICIPLNSKVSNFKIITCKGNIIRNAVHPRLLSLIMILISSSVEEVQFPPLFQVIKKCCLFTFYILYKVCSFFFSFFLKIINMPIYNKILKCT